MKTILSTLFFVLLLSACTTKETNKANESNDSFQSLKTNNQRYKTNEKTLLLGVWWNAGEKDAPTASFEINDSTIFYPDQEDQSEFRYHIKQDSIIINLDGYTSVSKIERVTKDTLELITDGEKQTFIKIKN